MTKAWSDWRPGIIRDIQRTHPSIVMLVLRLLAGLPLLVFGLRHFANLGHFRNIMVASGFPMVELNLVMAPAAECIAGLLLLSGLLARVGGLLGIGTMLPAIYATVTLAGLDVASLPAGLTEVPFTPPLPLPIVVLLCSAIVVWRGGGSYSLDAATGTP